MHLEKEAEVNFETCWSFIMFEMWSLGIQLLLLQSAFLIQYQDAYIFFLTVQYISFSLVC